MNQEIELKLCLDTAHKTRLTEFLNGQCSAGEPLRLLNRYYDTPAMSLSKAGAALRIRQQSSAEGNRTIQTLKTRGSSQGGLHQRMEWDWPLDEPELNTDIIKSGEAVQYLPEHLNTSDISPLFTTDFERQVWEFRDGDNHIEVVLDNGTVSNGRHSVPLLEAELELLSGQPEALFSLAEKLAEVVPVVMSDISKAERGYALAGHHDWLAKPPRLTLNAGLADSFKPLFAYELSNLQRSLEQGIWAGRPQQVVQAGWLLHGIRHLLKSSGSVVKRQQTTGIREQLDLLHSALESVMASATALAFGVASDDKTDTGLHNRFETDLRKLRDQQIWGQATVYLGQWLYDLDINDGEQSAGSWLGMVRKQLKQAWPGKRLRDAGQDQVEWQALLPKLIRLWLFGRYAPGVLPEGSGRLTEQLLGQAQWVSSSKETGDSNAPELAGRLYTLLKTLS